MSNNNQNCRVGKQVKAENSNDKARLITVDNLKETLFEICKPEQLK